MLKLKPGVRLGGLTITGLQPQMALAAVVVYQVYREAGARECVITSANDGKHTAANSRHYAGRALDFRTHGLDEVGIDPAVLLISIRDALGQDFDCLLEDHFGPNEHIHVEWDPKS